MSSSSRENPVLYWPKIHQILLAVPRRSLLHRSLLPRIDTRDNIRPGCVGDVPNGKHLDGRCSGVLRRRACGEPSSRRPETGRSNEMTKKITRVKINALPLSRTAVENARATANQANRKRNGAPLTSADPQVAASPGCGTAPPPSGCRHDRRRTPTRRAAGRHGRNGTRRP